MLVFRVLGCGLDRLVSLGCMDAGIFAKDSKGTDGNREMLHGHPEPQYPTHSLPRADATAS